MQPPEGVCQWVLSGVRTCEEGIPRLWMGGVLGCPATGWGGCGAGSKIAAGGGGVRGRMRDVNDVPGVLWSAF